MCTLTEKQFIKAVGKIDKEKYAEFLKEYPIDYTDEWIYEYQKYRFSGKGIKANTNHPIGSIHNGLDYETSGFYGMALYLMDKEEDLYGGENNGD